jgi:hypothetical protein
MVWETLVESPVRFGRQQLQLLRGTKGRHRENTAAQAAVVGLSCLLYGLVALEFVAQGDRFGAWLFAAVTLARCGALLGRLGAQACA